MATSRSTFGEARTSWGRGYIDLLGVDGMGTIQVVETKLADKNDAMIVFQSLDYYIFCEAYRDVITRRLDVVTHAPHRAAMCHRVGPGGGTAHPPLRSGTA